jgi:hypothetical protein
MWDVCRNRSAEEDLDSGKDGNGYERENKGVDDRLKFLRFIILTYLLEEVRLTRIFALECSGVFLEPGLAFFTGFEVDPTGGRQRIAYDI